jgi:hypothetical protein
MVSTNSTAAAGEIDTTTGVVTEAAAPEAPAVPLVPEATEAVLCDPGEARRIVLGGAMDAANPLSLLRANGLVWSGIFGEVDEAWVASAGVRVDRDACMFLEPWRRWKHGRRTVVFPESRGLNVNMMPFVHLNPKGTLPEELWPYLGMIRDCPIQYEKGKVAYLTVHESDVAPGATQWRPGLHVERPTVRTVTPGHVAKVGADENLTAEYRSLCWGMGHKKDGWPVDGIFMASTVAGSCTVWPITVDHPEKVTDAHGGIKGLDPVFETEKGRELAAGELCWITDRTPHRSNPNLTDRTVHRQFFRLVVGPIAVWYSILHLARAPNEECGRETAEGRQQKGDSSAPGSEFSAFRAVVCFVCCSQNASNRVYFPKRLDERAPLWAVHKLLHFHDRF